MTDWVKDSRVLPGSKDMIDILEDALAKVRAGEIEAVAIVMCDTEGMCWTNWSSSDTPNYQWARLYAGAATLTHSLMTVE